MAAWTLGVGILTGLATSGLLAAAGRITQQRPVSPDQRRSNVAFAVWWYGASLVILNQTLRTVLAVAGVHDPTIYTTLAYVGNLPLAAALGGLLYYLLYLLTGRRDVLAPVVLLYAGYYVYLTWFTTLAGPRTLVIGDWQAQLVGTATPAPIQTLLFGLLLAVPVFGTVGAYAFLAFRLHGTTQRYRLGLVATGFLLLFGMILVAYALQWNERTWFPLTYQLPALATAGLVLLAYRPPRWIQRRFGVDPVPSAGADAAPATS